MGGRLYSAETLCCRCKQPLGIVRRIRYCPPCAVKVTRAWLKRPGNKAKARKYQLDRLRMLNHGMSADEFDTLLKAQGGKCAICRKRETAKRGGVVKQMAVDHDHSTDQVRGLLCHRCNTAIGLMEEDTERLRQAAKYLERAHLHLVKTG